MKQNYILGLDLGTNSIGWACINEDKQKILDAGVRIFDRAEIPKTGESLAKPRREARLTRRRLHRRRVRLNKILNLLLDSGFITDKKQLQIPYEGNIWGLRVQALYSKLSDDELAKVIYHISKHRGFKSSKKEVDNPENKELTKANADMQNVVEAFESSGYKTIAEYMLHTYKDTNIRNKFGSYSQLIKQDLNKEELKLILQKQLEFGNTLIDDEFEVKLLDIFTHRKGLPSFEEMVGDCELEPTHKRAPKDSISASLFRAWSDINNIRYRESEESPFQTIPLDVRKELIQFAFDRANEGKKPTEVQIAKIINVGKSEKTDKAEYLMNFDIKKIAKSLTFDSYTKLKNVCEEKIWEQIKNNNEQIDAVIYCVAYLKEIKNLPTLKDPIIKEIITRLNWSDDIWEGLFDSLSFDGTMGHSLQAMWKLLPHFQRDDKEDNQPYTYYDCMEKAYEGHFNNRDSQNEKYLPKFNEHDITNPVVKRTLNQTRLLINKLISKYGKPQQINVELARDLGKSPSDRKKIEDMNKQNKANNDKYRKECEELGIKDIIMYRLWKEQHEECVYTGKSIGTQDLQDNNVEIDHILPISRSGDDSLMNKVLVFSYENQHKGNKTAFEYLSSKGEKELEEYKIRIEKIYSKVHRLRAKKERLLLENFDDKKSQEYKSRHLNDTRYISRLLVQHIDKTIRPEDKQYVKTIPGQATSVLRKLWGFHDKDRAESHKHHAFDAILIAGAGSKIKAWEHDVTKIMQYRYQADKGLSLGEKAQRNIERFGLHIDLPWEGFAEDARRYMENVFVSRMGKRKVTGEMHAQTILSRQFLPTEERIVKTINLQGLGKKEEDVIKHLNKMVDISFENGEVMGRSANVYKVILDHAKEYEWDMDKAFTQENAPQMPVKKDNPTHIPKIRKIKIYSAASSKIHPFNSMKSDKRQSAVDSGDVIRLDLFRDSKGKFEAVPVYPFHYKELPTPSDDKAEFMFSIYKNDYLSFEADKEKTFSDNAKYTDPKDRAKYKQDLENGKISQLAQQVHFFEGYYNTRDNSGRLCFLKDYTNKINYGVSIASMKKITKYYIDILGNRHLVASTDQPEEKRLTLKEVKAKWEEKNKRDIGSK